MSDYLSDYREIHVKSVCTFTNTGTLPVRLRIICYTKYTTKRGGVLFESYIKPGLSITYETLVMHSYRVQIVDARRAKQVRW